jgi:hypothetical protein
MNNTTRRHPRTLQEAFGPYTSHEIHQKPERRGEKLYGVMLAIVGAIALAALFVHQLSK